MSASPETPSAPATQKSADGTIPKPIDSTDATFATWSASRPDIVSEPPIEGPSASQGIRDAMLAMRRAQLARVVRGVVVASALLCLAAVVSKVVRSIGAEEAEAQIPASRHPGAGLVLRDLPPPTDPVARVLAATDVLSKRTLRALRVDEHRAAARVKSSARSRYTW